jgi:hypothetical protein
MKMVQNNINNNQMSPESFVYWLQGFFELTDAKTITTEQVEMIKQHLKYVFTPLIIITTTPPFTPGRGQIVHDPSGWQHVDPQGYVQIC